MPELPDVEVLRSYLDKKGLHQPVHQVEVFAEEVLEGISAREVHSQVTGRSFSSTARHGKYLFAELNGNGWVVFHFGMTGQLHWLQPGTRTPDHTRVLFIFSNRQSLAFVLRRKLGRFGIIPDITGFVATKGLGPDALSKELDLHTLQQRLKKTSGTIKGALTNQGLIAGIGNIYSDEILFQARIHPKNRANKLDREAMRLIFRKIGEVLQTAIDREADPAHMPATYLLPHRQKGGVCPVCGTKLKQLRISGRATFYCSNCQQ